MLEKNFIKLIRKNISFYNFHRIENTTVQGFPDMLCIGLKMDTILMEVKISKGNKINLTPHQIAYNLKLWNEKNKVNYIIVYVSKLADDPRTNNIYLYEGRKVKNLAINGINEPPTANNWPTISSYLLATHGT